MPFGPEKPFDIPELSRQALYPRFVLVVVLKEHTEGTGSLFFVPMQFWVYLVPVINLALVWAYWG